MVLWKFTVVGLHVRYNPGKQSAEPAGGGITFGSFRLKTKFYQRPAPSSELRSVPQGL